MTHYSENLNIFSCFIVHPRCLKFPFFGTSNSEEVLKIDIPKKKTKSERKISLKKFFFGKIAGVRSLGLQRYFSNILPNFFKILKPLFSPTGCFRFSVFHDFIFHEIVVDISIQFIYWHSVTSRRIYFLSVLWFQNICEKKQKLEVFLLVSFS